MTNKLLRVILGFCSVAWVAAWLGVTGAAISVAPDNTEFALHMFRSFLQFILDLIGGLFAAFYPVIKAWTYIEGPGE